MIKVYMYEGGKGTTTNKKKNGKISYDFVCCTTENSFSCFFFLSKFFNFLSTVTYAIYILLENKSIEIEIEFLIFFF